MSICQDCHYKLVHPNGSLDCLAEHSAATAAHKLRNALASGKCGDHRPEESFERPASFGGNNG